jgi:hypothetical protein
MEELDQEIENLKMILVDLEKKRIEKEDVKEDLIEELELLKKEMDAILSIIQEKREKKNAIKQEIENNYEDKSFFGKWDYQVARVSAIETSSYLPKIVNARLIPVNNDGIPIEQLGESKWTRKN